MLMCVLCFQAREVLENGTLGSDDTTQSSADVTITILDVNDNPPLFSQSHYSVNISEALQNGQALPNLLMSVSDSDGVSDCTVCQMSLYSQMIFNNKIPFIV